MVIALASLAVLASYQEPQVATPEVLRVGHVVEVRGALDEQGRFVSQRVELKIPTSDDALLGTVSEGETDAVRFTLLGQPVETDEETKWVNLAKGSLAGKRVKVEGSWKGPRKFSADEIETRGAGRDRIAARVDAIRKVEGGWELSMMSFTVLLEDDTQVEHEEPVSTYGLAPERQIGRPGEERDIEREEDDAFGKGIELTDTLRFMGQIEGKIGSERDYDLRSDRDEDRTDYDLAVRARVAWAPSARLAGLFELRYTEQYRRDDDNGVNDSEVNHDGNFGETWIQWRDLLDRAGFDLTVGRQDFDDLREWIYDQNLDALRLSWIQPAWRLDLSTAILVNGGERDEASRNALVYLSNNDRDTHLALWTVYRDFDDFNADNGFVPDEESWHFGTRAVGEWLPRSQVWAELAFEQGERPLFDSTGTSTGVTAEVSAWAYDAGATWSPAFAEPLYFTAGYALGSGDASPGSGDGTFRQTGLQDNTDRFGGITSFQYYGELLDPELSNLGILTLGVGARVATRTSLDVIFHTYTQDEASPEFSPLPSREADLKARPNGLDADLGWETDLVFGFRRFRNWDLEIVGAAFEPGDGFDGEDRAYFAKFQLRYRF